MATRIKNVVDFGAVAAGATEVLPHFLNIDPPGGQGGPEPQIPDLVLPSVIGAFTVTADATNVTVTNNTGGPINLQVYVETWHSLERAFGPQATTELVPRPFVVGGAAGGAALMPSGVLSFGTNQISVLADATGEIPPWWELADEAEPADVGIVVPRDGTLRNLFVRHADAGVEAGLTTYTVVVNGAPTALAVTLSSDVPGQGSDLVDSVPVEQGDNITLEFLNGEEGGGGTVAVTISMEFDI